ncbi:hypothetical protein ACN082_09965 [Rothia sp. CCM 9417]|uniref:hypothetical protein n=1 Tax=Rothia sp. CCM 9417 TaxID=3402657 RepID=UPI003AE38BAD
MDVEEIVRLGEFRGWVRVKEASILLGRSVKSLQNAHSARSGVMAFAYKVEGERLLRVPFDDVMRDMKRSK